MMPPWLPAAIDHHAHTDELKKIADAQQESESEEITIKKCQETLRAALQILPALDIGIETLQRTHKETCVLIDLRGKWSKLVDQYFLEYKEVEKLIDRLKEHTKTLLNMPLPKRVLPETRKNLLEKIVATVPNSEDRGQLQNMQRDLMLALTSIREHLEAAMSEESSIDIGEPWREILSQKPVGYRWLKLENRTKVKVIGMVDKDIPEAVHLDRRVSGEDAWSEETYFDRIAQTEKYLHIVARDTHGVVGVAVCEIKNREFIIKKFMVDPSARRHRVGQQLMEGVKEVLKIARFQRLSVDTQTSAESDTFLQSQEFTVSPDSGQLEYFRPSIDTPYIGPARINNRLDAYFRALDDK